MINTKNKKYICTIVYLLPSLIIIIKINNE